MHILILVKLYFRDILINKKSYRKKFMLNLGSPSLGIDFSKSSMFGI